MDTNKTLEKLKSRNTVHSDAFINSEGSRIQYWAKHPTRTIFLGCMDGRVNFLAMTNKQAGIAKVLKQRGGVFDLAFNYFGTIMIESYKNAIRYGKDVLVFASYHYDKHDDHFGCAGHNYETGKAIDCAENIIQQFFRIFRDRGVFDAVMIGIETRSESLVFHGRDSSKVYKTIDHINTSKEKIFYALRELYPDMKEAVFNDLVEYALGNQQYLKKHEDKITKDLQVDHKERVIAVGRGHEFIFQTTGKDGDEPLANFCLSVGPYNDKFKEEIKTSLKVIFDNIIKRGMDVSDGFVLFASAIYENQNVAKCWAIEKAEKYAKDAIDVLSEDSDFMKEIRSVIVPHLIIVTAIIDKNTRKMDIMDTKPASYFIDFIDHSVRSEVATGVES